jgi:F-type H+-transporting ATPase subunit b
MQELLENLEIKWQLLLAQAVNFFILLFILKRFLYKPMLKFLRGRREAIEASLKKSEAAEQQFKEMRGIQAKELAKTRMEAQKIVDEAKKRSQDAQNQIMEDARKQTEAIFAKSEKDIKQMKTQMLQGAEREIGRLAIEGMEYLLKEQVSEEKKKELADTAIKYIKSVR